MEPVGRTRYALGEIGNRLTHKVTSVKDKAAASSGNQFCLPDNGKFVVPTGPAPVTRGTKVLVNRANSVLLPPPNNGIGQRVTNKARVHVSR